MTLTDNTAPEIKENIIDINLAGVQKTRFRINGDNNAIIELNTSDIGAVFRLEEAYPKLHDQLKNIAELNPEDPGFNEALKEADRAMREQIDYIFDSPVSEVCAKNGTMYDPFEGSFRFEHILNCLTKLYETTLNDEYKKMNARIQKHTSKYTKSRKK